MNLRSAVDRVVGAGLPAIATVASRASPLPQRSQFTQRVSQRRTGWRSERGYKTQAGCLRYAGCPNRGRCDVNARDLYATAIDRIAPFPAASTTFAPPWCGSFSGVFRV